MCVVRKSRQDVTVHHKNSLRESEGGTRKGEGREKFWTNLGAMKDIYTSAVVRRCAES